jgi:hypothetical protein
MQDLLQVGGFLRFPPIIWSVYGYVRYLHIDGFLLFVYICKISFKGITLPRFVPVPRPNLDFHPQMTAFKSFLSCLLFDPPRINLFLTQIYL